MYFNSCFAALLKIFKTIYLNIYIWKSKILTIKKMQNNISVRYLRLKCTLCVICKQWFIKYFKCDLSLKRTFSFLTFARYILNYLIFLHEYFVDCNLYLYLKFVSCFTCKKYVTINSKSFNIKKKIIKHAMLLTLFLKMSFWPVSGVKGGFYIACFLKLI